MVILVSVFVCTLAIQGAATRMMFSMGRDRHLPLGRLWGSVNPTFKTPANAAVAVGVLAALPILLVGPIGGFTLSIAATGLIYLSYFLCNVGVAMARTRGWPHKPAWFNLGRWGMLVNILALIYGGVMIINIALWHDENLFGNFGTANRELWNPFINGLFEFLGQPLEGLAGVAAVRVHRRHAAGDRAHLLPGRGARHRARRRVRRRHRRGTDRIAASRGLRLQRAAGRPGAGRSRSCRSIRMEPKHGR